MPIKTIIRGAGEKSTRCRCSTIPRCWLDCSKRGELKFSGSLEKTVTYHDPCYLGKHNGVFDEPRAVLSSIPGVKLVEMDRSREKSLCCEGGGGRMWLEGTNPGTRLAQQRIQEALDTGARGPGDRLPVLPGSPWKKQSSI